MIGGRDRLPSSPAQEKTIRTHSTTGPRLRLGLPIGRIAPLAWQWAPWVAVFSIFWWVAVTALINPAQYADSIEQFNWAHGLELGYWKHPPLTTWLMAAAVALAGPSPYVSYALAALCYGGTALFTWKIAGMLLPARGAALAVLLLSLHHGFSWRAQIYNHNAVLLLMTSAFVWSGLRCARGGRLGDWVLAGALAGLALLAKYQAAVPILCVLFGLWHSGVLRDRAARRYLAVAVGVAALVFAPHGIWALLQGIPGLHYLQQSAPELATRSRDAAWFKFFANQVSLNFSMLLVAGIVALWRGAPVADASEAQPASSSARALPVQSWLLALVAGPVLIVSVVIVFGGFTPQKFWGLGTLQFLGLLLAWLLHRRGGAFQVAKVAVLCLAVSATGTGYYAVESRDAAALRKLHSMDRIWPAKELAAAALADWRAATACPLKYVVGPGFPSGLISVYSGAYPAVLEDGDERKSPWIDAQDLRNAGAIVVKGPASEDHTLPGGANSMQVPAHAPNGGAARVEWTVVKPLAGACSSAPGP